MIDNILAIKNKESFDFRRYVNPLDDLSYLFDDWVAYYQLKYAICKALAPRSILELGVRYGYSAITFLSAAPHASYVGIDNNSETFGGKVDAFQWAKKITAGFDASFLIADTQQLATFPGEQYDLIHVDAQQDGDGTYHDLELALEKGTWVLVDGFFWSNENMLSSTYFLKKYCKFIEYSIVIPGYAGELLIKTRKQPRFLRGTGVRSYKNLANTYDADYFLQDCGGYEVYKQTGGLVLKDLRLLAVYALASPRKGQRILDVGCGRGELAFALATSGAETVGVDYATDSITLAQKTYADQDVCRQGRLSYVQGDILESDFPTAFDTIIAADFVEHIDEEMLEKAIGKMNDCLTPDGRLIIHTAPNRLHYRYDYARRRKVAKAAGTYLPPNPRTVYEDLMHINEQTPARLHRLLKKHFTHVCVWAASLPDMAGTLERGLSRRELAKATGIFAVASQQPIERDNLLAVITQHKLDSQTTAVELMLNGGDFRFAPAEKKVFNATLVNKCPTAIVSWLPFPVYISYHWKNEQGETVIFDGIRTPLGRPIQSDEKRECPFTVIAPEQTGTYILEITLVQEQVFWFEEVCPSLPVSFTAVVLGCCPVKPPVEEK